MTRHSTIPEAVAWLLGEQEGHCGCSGQCGDRHEGGRCDTGELGLLSVAPADRSIPIEWSTTLPADDLLVWCRPCRDSAEAAARKDRLKRLDRELDCEPAEASDAASTSDPGGLRLNWWLQGVLEDFYAARDQWDADCEAYSKGYATEAAEFAEQRPRPQLRDFLRDHAHGHADTETSAEEVSRATGAEPADAEASTAALPAGSYAVDRARRAVDQLALRQPHDRQRRQEAGRDLDSRSQDGHADRGDRFEPAGLGW